MNTKAIRDRDIVDKYIIILVCCKAWISGDESQRYVQCRSALPPMNTLEGTPYRATDMTMTVLLASPESHSRKNRPVTQRLTSGLKVALNSAGEILAARALLFLQVHWKLGEDTYHIRSPIYTTRYNTFLWSLWKRMTHTRLLSPKVHVLRTFWTNKHVALT